MQLPVEIWVFGKRLAGVPLVVRGSFCVFSGR
jgi:hypothetical protein